MNIQQIRHFLETFRGGPVGPEFKFDRYHTPRDDGEVRLVTHERYLPPLGNLIRELKPVNILTIGALFGTTESYVLQCCGGREFLGTITIYDLDISDYNPRRDNGSLIYRNICGTSYGGHERTFTHIRGSSRWPDVMRKIEACGPFDMVFVDGEHTAEAVYSDIELAAKCLSPRGTILVHDTSLFSSSVPAGWSKWATDHCPEWICDAVPDETFFLGLGFVQRTSFQ